MNLVSVLKGEAKKAALKSLAEGRLWWRVSDQYGRSCNGGKPFSLPPSSPGKPGKWAPVIKNVQICSRGYHVTNDPIKWQGCVCTLVEAKKVIDTQGDKAVCETLHELGVVDPLACIDQRIWVFCRGRFALLKANLRGANLYGANLDDLKKRGAII